MSESTEIQVHAPQPVQGQLAQYGAFSGDMQSFENAQRIATALSKSTLVPRDYQNNLSNCMLAMEMSQRVNANPLAVMQNLHIIQGRPSWSSQFTIAALNGCGRFSPLRFDVSGGPEDLDNWGCRAWALDLSTDDRLEGPMVSIKMAKDEGWYSKNGSKWKTMPDLMLRYRAAKFFGNLYAPDILMGMSTDDEVHDIAASRNSVRREIDVTEARPFNPGRPAEEPNQHEEVQEAEQQEEPFNPNNF